MNMTKSKHDPASFDREQPTHTPGPWKTAVFVPQGSADAQWDVCRAGGGDRVATIDDQGSDPEQYRDVAETEANARLIAAAPELLAALEDVELRCTQARLASTIGKKKDRSDFLRSELQNIANDARAAIEKATKGT